MVSSRNEQGAPTQGAEATFREAFIRLKIGRPINLPARTPVSQNNVAREAGKDPSALKKSRFPLLVDDIQSYLQERDAKKSDRRNELEAAKQTIEKLRSDLLEAIALRDDALSQLMAAELTIIELRGDIRASTKQTNVRSLTPKKER